FYDTVSVTGSYDFSGAILGRGSASVSADEAVISIPVVSAKRFKGWHCRYDEQGYLEMTFYSKPSSLSGYTIMLDAGHGGYDGGASCAVSPSAWNESKINLSIASKIKTLLENEGARVIMTRSDGGFLSLTGRTDLARRYKPDIFISIHCDASSSASAYGTSAFYYRAFSQPLASSIHNAIVSCWKNNIYAGMNRTGSDRGSLFAAYRVTRIEECPSVLIEYGFVTNPVECQALENGTNRDLLAKATVTGIKNYINYSS
ncbi:MAG: N-acetylmuramoyl-L-alanine amidase, partial [Clostridia bacterium]|nr:N-acetylmuramoyl-L-alanine amidase [Clostridia bacterium]